MAAIYSGSSFTRRRATRTASGSSRTSRSSDRSMLRARIIPCLLVRNRGLVKTRKFGDDKYVGDPINAVRIFNEKQVDELVVLDIDATAQRREPDYRMIEHLA